MIIQEKDFKIIFNDDHYVLYLLKSKKELKENSEDTFKLCGYFIQLISSLKRVHKFRLDKKYPGKESSIEIKKTIDNYIEIESNLFKLLKNPYNLIYDLTQKILNNEIS